MGKAALLLLVALSPVALAQMGAESLELAGSMRTVILLIAAAAVTVNIGLTSYYMFRKSINEASV